MLHEFVTSNREELIKRCREKVAERFRPADVPPAIDHGVPLFLLQLVDMLRTEQLSLAGAGNIAPQEIISSSEITRAAAIHGADLLRQGFTIDQVVHEYGAVCQSVTELAVELEAPISTEEFRTLNRCLDDAIADAVRSWGLSQQIMIDDRSANLQARLDAFENEHRRLINIALRAFAAIRTGNVGLTGSTGALLLHAITELQSLAQLALPELRASAVFGPFGDTDSR